MKITLATKITIARIFLIIPTVVCFVLANMLNVSEAVFIALTVLSAFLFAVCCATDFVDGHIARKTNTVSMLGKLLDPLADKVVIVIMLFLLVYFGGGLNTAFACNTLVVALLSGIILSRELMIGVFRSIAASRGLVLAADIYGKIKTVCLDIGVTIMMLAPLHVVLAWVGTIVFYIGAILAVYSGLNYLVKNKHVLKQDDENQEEKEEAQNAENN